MSESVWIAIIGGMCGGSAIAAIINQIGEAVRQKRKRKYDLADTESEDVKAIKAGLKWVMYDRIRYLGQAYIKDGCIDLDDRRILHEMHTSYHSGLGGNGDLDLLMGQVDKLPLKMEA